ncbi:MBOAT family O-acyltransferase [Burkholderiaceae bacterium UC74_6]
MLFTSFEFLLYFLPLALGGYYLVAAGGWRRAAAAWLALLSLVFYGWWSPAYTLLLLGSIVFNYGAGLLVARALKAGGPARAKPLLTLAVGLDLAALAYFKYADFFIGSLDKALGLHIDLLGVVLPLGISFFTFTQIAFLVDTYAGKVREARFVHYLLFVTYFPHLIAGPVLHHAEMMPQFEREQTYRFQLENFLAGTVLLLIGLAKKILLADGIQPFVAPVFDHGLALGGVEAWCGVLAYALQLYFDFSGYSDMAIGLAWMFNVNLPLNFNSPYKATSIVDFWRRWHMTLSRFLRDYLYIALGGNRRGFFRRYLNLFLTMVLGGLWHGAGWTFVIWGALHGAYLIVNHAWAALCRKLALPSFGAAGRVLSVLLTFACVCLAWVFFRAKDLDSALVIVHAMSGSQGWALPIEWRASLLESWPSLAAAFDFKATAALAGTRQLGWIAVLLSMAWFLPNSQQIMASVRASGPWRAGIRNGAAWTVLGAGLTLILLLAVLNRSLGVSEFIYFNF